MNLFTLLSCFLPCFTMAVVSNSYVAKFMSERRKKLMWAIAIIGTVSEIFKTIFKTWTFPII